MNLRLGGLVPWSSVDYPGRQAAVLFVTGCPWRCPYCHNSHLWAGEAGLSWAAVRGFLETRVGLLDAVVVSGGEPLAQATAVHAALVEVRTLGFATALHTAGVSPRRLQTLLGDLDWVGLDVKGPFSRYDAITAREGSGAAARASVEAVLRSAKPHELRTTVHPELLSDDDLLTMLRELVAMGARSVTLKNFRPTGCPDARLAATYRPWLKPELATELRAIMPGVVLPDG
ncbi:anaerobic ribonucleoside-triphosphate reductase activating protein [Acidiferrobacter thiooxydans]|uniref:anaerobic ribonucleoside-triphosphate reductase activating protein n=1 Tax=Acidiferrobacter thiooxydans TaxID=163359 RepID=UPI00082660C9|nr:anaerobic ribonucleoside-triphosphate reductase activating protein [Acidiferrobacter thiooxydans]MDA8189898.1 anaerobic ribonucleoside-triphosphate reductase activating protein [Gammaproteobacteria bacterium]UEO00028.1 anaerobic ribonucleoside-triphosphate reductase activating protein [Acidiferrobacter thiooxydans]